MNIRHSRRLTLAAGLSLALVVPLAACAETSEPGGDDNLSNLESFTVLSANENEALRTQLDALAANQCATQNEVLPLEHQTTAQADTVQTITLRASQGALPAHFIAGTAQVRPSGDLGQANLVLDLEEALTEAGAWDNVLPAASSTVKNVYGHMVSMPYQYNIEGIWYNKAIFAEVGISEPQTFDELIAASDALLAAGYQPFAMPGAANWPLTRLMGMYIHRNVGPEAMIDIRDANRELTEAEYLAGAQALADMAAAGYFGDGFISTEPAAANAAFLSGQAAMKYDGSWFLGNINNADDNLIGAENVGLMPFPAVSGGAGDINHWAANAGTAHAVNPETYDSRVADWLSCIAENYGAQALGSAGIISGFAVNSEVTGVPETTAAVQETITTIEQTVLWFEALFDSESNSLAQSNVSLLVTGQMTPEQYMDELQASLNSNR